MDWLATRESSEASRIVLAFLFVGAVAFAITEAGRFVRSHTSADTPALADPEVPMTRAGRAIQTQWFQWGDLAPLMQPITARIELGLRDPRAWSNH